MLAHCAVSSMQPLTCVQVACSAVPVLLWNSFHPCSTGIPHHLSCHSGRLCLGPGPGGVGGCKCWGRNRVCLCVPVLSASLATPRDVEATVSILFFSELFFYQDVDIIKCV